MVEKNNAGTVTQSILYVYDVWDRRIEKSFDADGAGSGTVVVTRWAYDGQNVLLTVDATGLVTHRYLHGPGTDQILADDYIGAEKYFPLTDNLGTVRDILDHTGAVRNHIDYNAFGRVTAETTAAFDFLFGYTGFERDEETGLLHSDTRYYDAVHALWPQEDWIVFRGGDYNLYRYVGNKATNFIDPSGLDETVWTAEGRVKGDAIELDLNGEEGSLHQQPIDNTDGTTGKVDVLAGGSRSTSAEIGPATASGVDAKLHQVRSRAERVNVILYYQNGEIPLLGDCVSSAELTPEELAELHKLSRKWDKDQIWDWIVNVKKKAVRVSTVTAESISLAGPAYEKWARARAKAQAKMMAEMTAEMADGTDSKRAAKLQKLGELLAIAYIAYTLTGDYSEEMCKMQYAMNVYRHNPSGLNAGYFFDATRTLLAVATDDNAVVNKVIDYYHYTEGSAPTNF